MPLLGFTPISPIRQKPRLRPLLSMFINRANKDIATINLLIEKYNNSSDSTAKLETLYQIYQHKKTLELALPLEQMINCPEYSAKIHYQLFNALKTEFAQFGIHSMREEFIKAKITDAHVGEPDSTSLAETLANMAPEKVSKLLENLSAGSDYSLQQFKELYQPTEIEYAAFQSFLSTHSIEFLGGSNAKNFKITHEVSGHSSVLKADSRLGYPRAAEEVLRKGALSNTLTPIAAERQANISVDGKPVTSSLVVTDFCLGSDLESHANLQHSTSQRMENALSIYTQMSKALDGIVSDGCAFPDMKNSNWLLSAGKLQLADTKSLVFIDKDQHMVFGDNKTNIWVNDPLQSEFISPPEFARSQVNCSADKMHAYMLGKNLFQYLTTTDYVGLYYISDASDINFSDAIFQNEEGHLLQDLIKDLVKKNPAERISVHEASTRLELISLKHEIRQLLISIAEHPLAANNQQITKFTQEKAEQLNGQLDPLLITQIKTELAKTLEQINNPQVVTVDKKPVYAPPNKERMRALSACNSLFSDLENHTFSANDGQMAKFIEEKRSALKEIRTTLEGPACLAAIEKIRGELDETLSQMQKDPVILAVRAAISTLQNKNSFYTIGVAEKIDRIERAMAKVPLAERSQVDQGATAATRQVLNEMASLRGLFKKSFPVQNGEIVEAKAADTYKQFKQRLKDIKPIEIADLTETNSPTKRC